MVELSDLDKRALAEAKNLTPIEVDAMEVYERLKQWEELANNSSFILQCPDQPAGNRELKSRLLAVAEPVEGPKLEFTVADLLPKDLLDTIVPDPNEKVDFCVGCRELRWIKEQRKQGKVCGSSVENWHVCINDLYRTGELHDIVKKIVMQILSKIVIGTVE